MKKQLKRMKTTGRNKKNLIAKTAALTTVLLAGTPQVVSAAGFDSITGAITTLKTGLFAVIAGVGVIILGKNIMEAATAWQQQDSASLNNAIKGIVAGGLMMAVGSIVTALNIT